MFGMRGWKRQGTSTARAITKRKEAFRLRALEQLAPSLASASFGVSKPSADRPSSITA
jgi:hypothetical protein